MYIYIYKCIYIHICIYIHTYAYITYVYDVYIYACVRALMHNLW